MAKQKCLITADCRVNGGHVAAGTPVEFDDEKKADKELYGVLRHAGRLCDDTPENRKALGTKTAAPAAK